MQYREEAMFVLVACIGLVAIHTPVAAQNESRWPRRAIASPKFNAQSAFSLSEHDQEQFNWATSDTNGNETSGSNPCTALEATACSA